MKAIFVFLATAMLAFPGFGEAGPGRLVFRNGALEAFLSWDQGPDGNGGESILRIEWRDGATRNAVEPGVPFRVRLWMPSMGHGSAPTQLQRVLDGEGRLLTGVYRATNAYFPMPGEWNVEVILGSAGGTETRAWPVLVEGDGGGHHH